MKSTITILFLAFSSYLNAQTVIRGNVLEENHTGIESASVSLFRGADTTVFKSIITDKNGRFSFTTKQPGTYHIGISAIGYESSKGSGFAVTSGTKPLNLPDFI